MKDSIKTLEQADRRFTVPFAISLNLAGKLSKRTLCQFFMALLASTRLVSFPYPT
jgi:hypothetical protein